MIEKINEKIEKYLQGVLEKDAITREEFELLVSYRNTEESRMAMKKSMEMLNSMTAITLPLDNNTREVN
ncbi:MAG: hypothetical protein IJ418_02210 [Clostridia bacterium]|nr:hypothetical protein [Clostridia bacterium]MBQ8616305.1 hypothetical protein [Clostridia bacterium]